MIGAVKNNASTRTSGWVKDMMIPPALLFALRLLGFDHAWPGLIWIGQLAHHHRPIDLGNALFIPRS
jgi:hypothetical protein